MKMEFFQPKRSQLIAFGMLCLALTVESMQADTLIERMPLGENRTEITVACYTDNLAHMGESQLRAHLCELAKHACPPVAPHTARAGRSDVLVFGFQEARIGKGPNSMGFDTKEADKTSFNFVGDALEAYLGIDGYTRAHETRVTWGSFKKGIYLYIFTKRSSGVTLEPESIQTNNKRFGKYWYTRYTGGNKGCALITGTFKKGIMSKKMTFLCCHNSSDSLKKNTKDFVSCVNLVNKYPDAHAVFMLGDFNPRTKESTGSDKWIKGETKKKEGRWPCKKMKTVWSQYFVAAINGIIKRNTGTYNEGTYKKTADEKKVFERIRRAIIAHISECRTTNKRLSYPVDAIDTLGDLKSQHGFSEQEIRFEWTYKYRRYDSTGQLSHVDGYTDNLEVAQRHDLICKKTLQWTDRVLYKIKENSNTIIRHRGYDAIPRQAEAMRYSDHNVVCAKFAISSA